jgi:polysaccharide biosynthesis/export protein
MASKSEAVMKHVLLVLSTICILCTTAISQIAPGNPQTRLPQGAAPITTPLQSSPAGASSEDFVIGPEDVIEIKVWHETELTTRGVVRPDGKIGVTLLGDVQASGLTTAQLKQSIGARLSRFLEQPEVSVVVVEIHSQMVHLIGSVGRPGAYALGGPLTVVELLARAGGLTETAKSEDIAIVRTKSGGVVERISFNYKAFTQGKNLQNVALKNGDVVVVR